MDEPAVRAQLDAADITVGPLHRNLPAPELIARSLARGEGIFAANGALVVTTGERTGRSPADRYIVDEPGAEDVDWGASNQPCTPEFFDRQVRRVSDYLRRREVYVFDGFIGAEPTYRTPIRVVTRASWHGLFAHTLFVRPEPIDLEHFEPDFTVIDCGELPVDARPEAPDGDAGGGERPSPVFVGVSLSRRLVIILGTMYGGEMKKALFTAMNYLLPKRNVLPMHCSATAGPKGDVALYFGLSGTGKTTLSADPARRLIGDDEHGWSDHGVFNFEGGCYAKVHPSLARPGAADLRAIRFGSILENVIIDPVTRAIDWDDDSITENTRATIRRPTSRTRSDAGWDGTPRNVFFLACDAYGVLPPISKLTPEMASYHFLSGFTAKVAGTEEGVVEPEPTFSACFGARSCRAPVEYADMLADRLRTSRTQCWLVNTGWTGGPYGVGKACRSTSLARSSMPHSRARSTASRQTSIRYSGARPAAAAPVCRRNARPARSTSAALAYDATATKLARLFIDNFERFAGRVSPNVAASGPLVAVS